MRLGRVGGVGARWVRLGRVGQGGCGWASMGGVGGALVSEVGLGWV